MLLLISGLGRFPGEGNGNPLQYSCLRNLMDRGAWWATVHGITKESYMTQWLKCDNSNFAFLSQVFSDLETSMHLVGRGCLLWPVLSFGRTLLAFALYSKAKFACYSRCFLTSYFCNPVPLNEKDIFFGHLTKCGPLEKKMANHFSIPAFRTPWAVWKGKKIGHWKMNSPGW